MPKVLRRVGGYNLDVCCPQSERPYTADGSVNYAHLLVGSEGTLAWTRELTLQLAPLPVHRALGVVNFPTLYKAMESARHLVGLGPSAVELVDRTMIDLARGNPAFRAVIDRALIGEPDAILLVEFIGETRDEPVRRLRDLVALMGDLGLPGSVVEMTDAGAQKALWEVRKAGLNIMMSLKGDGKPVSFIEDCAVPLEHLADYVDRLTQVFARHGTRGTWYAHASVGTLHVRPILDLRRDGAAKMRAIAEEASAMVREYKGAFSGEHGDGLVRTEWVGWQFGPRLSRAFEEIKDLFDPAGLMNPGKIVRGTKMDDASLFRFPPGYRIQPMTDGARLVRLERAERRRQRRADGGRNRRRPRPGFREGRRDVQQQRALPQVRRGDDVPELPRDARRGARHARPRQHAAPRAVRKVRERRARLRGGARSARPLRELQGLPARMPDRRRHGEDEDRGALPAATRARPAVARAPGRAPAALGAVGLAVAVARESARRGSRRGEALAKPGSASRRGARCPRGGATRSCAAPFRRRDGSAVDADVVLFVDTFTNYFEPENAAAALNVLRAAGYRVHVARADVADSDPARPLCCGRTYLAAGLVDEAKAEARRMVAALSPHVERGAAIVGLEPSCLLSLRDEFLVMGLGESAQRLAESAFLVEEFLARERNAGRLALSLAPLPQQRALLHAHCHQKAFDAVAATQTVLGLVPGPRGRVGRVELLRDGGKLRLRRRALRRVGADGRAVAPAGRARGGGGHADRRGRHELPAPDRRSHARRRTARADPRRARARARAPSKRHAAALNSPVEQIVGVLSSGDERVAIRLGDQFDHL